MYSAADRHENLLCERLCGLAGVSRGKHRRWQSEGLLETKDRYSERDVVRAAILDECNTVLGPSLAQHAWRQVESDLGTMQGHFEIVVQTTTRQAWVIRSAAELMEVLPRGEPVMVVRLDRRASDARKRVLTFREAS